MLAFLKSDNINIMLRKYYFYRNKIAKREISKAYLYSFEYKRNFEIDRNKLYATVVSYLPGRIVCDFHRKIGEYCCTEHVNYYYEYYTLPMYNAYK